MNTKLIVLLFFIASCAIQPTKETDKKPIGDSKPKPIERLSKGWHDSYTAILMDALKDKPYHKRYDPSDRSWLRFYMSLSAAESAHNPYDIYWEKTLGSPKGYYAHGPTKGMKYYSMGLYQLSHTDSIYYKEGCKFDIEADKLKADTDHTQSIFNPELNIRCAVYIMELNLKKYATPFFDKGNYWIVLKPNSKYWSKKKGRYVYFKEHFEWYYNVKYKGIK